jgi:hypothetical protein
VGVWARNIGRLRCLRGIDTLSALGLVAEVGALRRLRPRALTAPAGAIALIVPFYFMPGVYQYVLVLERRQGAIRTFQRSFGDGNSTGRAVILLM